MVLAAVDAQGRPAEVFSGIAAATVRRSSSWFIANHVGDFQGDARDLLAVD